MLDKFPGIGSADWQGGDPVHFPRNSTGAMRAGIMETIEHKILRSGVFKLDDKSNPVGIMELAVYDIEFIPYPTNQLRKMILDLSYAIASYLGVCRTYGVTHSESVGSETSITGYK